jgi:hypothetical protein
MMLPTVSSIVHYVLTQEDADSINKRRNDARALPRSLREDGVQIHFGNPVAEEDFFPMIVVKVWPDGLINGQVFLDGNDTLWVTSVSPATLDDGYLGRWSWPPRI